MSAKVILLLKELERRIGLSYMFNVLVELRSTPEYSGESATRFLGVNLRCSRSFRYPCMFFIWARY
jgi:hypothetical protein